jgi:hypothetical protein
MTNLYKNKKLDWPSLYSRVSIFELETSLKRSEFLPPKNLRSNILQSLYSAMIIEGL